MSQYGELYLPVRAISVPEDNDALVTIRVKDKVGDLVDISGAAEISFAVWDVPGGTLQFQKTLSGSGISIGGDNASFNFWVNDTDTVSTRLCYFEAQVTLGDGRKRTVAAGQYRAESTYTGGIV